MRISSEALRQVANTLNDEQVASLIDHTELNPHVLKKKIRSICVEADTHRFATVCVNSCWVREASQFLKSRSSHIGVASVVGFPLGQMFTASKSYEASDAVADGATEIDMVINVGSIREMTAMTGEEAQRIHESIHDDIGTVVKKPDGVPVKVILETGFLTDQEVVEAYRISEEAGAAFVKISTGFGPMGALKCLRVLKPILRIRGLPSFSASLSLLM